MRSLRSLPKPCQMGHYWFADKDNPGEDAPAILRFAERRLGGQWFLSLGKQGMYWVRDKAGEYVLGEFEDPQQALYKLQHLLGRRS